MKLLAAGTVVVCGLAVLARADTTDPFSYAHASPGAKLDPFAYPHGLPVASAYSGRGAASVPPDVVAHYAAAPLDPAVARRLGSYLDALGLEGGLVTSRGDRMFYTWSVTGTDQIWRQDGAMKYPVQLTGGEDSTRLAGLAPDDSFVVVSRDRGGAENPGLYLLAPSGGALRTIHQAPNVQTELAFISDDSAAIYFRANDRDPASYAIYRYDVNAGTTELVFDTPGLWSVIDHQRDTWLLAKRLGNAHVEIWTYEPASRELRPRLGVNESEDYQAVFGPRPGQLLVRTNKLGDFQRLYSLERDVLTPIGPEPTHDIASFWIDRTRSRLYYTTTEDGYLRLAARDARTLKPIAVPALAAADSTTVASLSATGRFVQLVLSGSTVAPMAIVLDWQTGRTTTWRTAATPELDPSTFAKAELESYPARDGVRIPMLVRRPAKCATMVTPCPVIVSFHGGPEGQALPEFSPYIQAFVEAGFVFVAPNVRGSDGYGKAWLHADDGPKRLDVITDIEDCAKYLRQAWAKNGVEPRLGVFGASYGGYSVLLAMTLYAGAYDAGVEAVGISNLETFLTNTAPYRRILRISEYGDPVKDKVALEKLSPINYVDRAKAPLLLFAGVNDPRVPVGEALQIHDALVAHRIDTGLVLFPDEGHGVTKRANLAVVLGRTIEFFAKHLQ